jgi:polysaccharide biosynthesis/export protein
MNAQASLGRACSPSRCARLPIVRVLAVAAGLLHLAVVDARAEYRLQPCDVLEFSVAGVQDFRQRMAVNLDGDVSLPLVGPIHVAGSSLSDLRARLMELLPSKVLRQRAVDGKELLVVVGPDDATINIAEYWPVYVVGDVAKPGEQPYRPGMTVRQAIQTADVGRVRNLYDRGLASLNRVTDEQRSLWFASERLLQTAAQAAQVRRNEQELSRQLEKTSDHRRMDLLKEIEGATVKLSAIRARLSATSSRTLGR